MRFEVGPRLATALAVAGVVGIGATVASAAIPSLDGSINGCYESRTGLLRVIDAEAGAACTSREQGIRWNQQGPKGDTGAQGAAGPEGVAGPQGPKGDPGQGGVAGYQTWFKVKEVPPGTYFSVYVPCPDPKRALTGGWSSGHTDLDLQVDGVSSGLGYDVRGANNTAYTREITVYVTCGDVASFAGGGRLYD